MAKISLKFSLAKLKNPNGHKIQFCSIKSLPVQISAQEKPRCLVLFERLVGSRWLWGSSDVNSWNWIELLGEGEGRRPKWRLSGLYRFLYCYFWVPWGNVLQIVLKLCGMVDNQESLGKASSHDFSPCATANSLHFRKLVRTLVFPNRLWSILILFFSYHVPWEKILFVWTNIVFFSPLIVEFLDEQILVSKSPTKIDTYFKQNKQKPLFMLIPTRGEISPVENRRPHTYCSILSRSIFWFWYFFVDKTYYLQSCSSWGK